MNTDNQWATLSLFVSGTHIRQQFGCLFKMLKCQLYWRLTSFIDVHLNVIDVIKAGGPICSSKNVHEVWSWSCFNRWLRRRVTSHPQTSPRIDVVDTSSHRSQSHHRIQMWCQMLINCNGKWTSFGSNTNMHKNKV